MDALTLSLGRNILKSGSRERTRMQKYAAHLKSLHIIVLTRKEHGYTTEIHEGNLHVYPTNSRGRIMMLVDALMIGSDIVKKQEGMPLVISSQDPFEMGLIALVLARKKHTTLHVQLHGDYFGSPFWRGNSPVRVLRLLLARFIMKRAAGIRVVSERIKKSLLARGVDERSITVLPIRPELETFLGTPYAGGAHTPFVFLIASRFSPEKNIPLMIRAFARIAREHQNIHLRIVGRGEGEKKISSLVRALGIVERVTFIPWTEALEVEMQQADVFLLSSDHEAYGLTLVEALAAGLPIITTDVGCVGEVIQDEVHGIVVPVRDETAFTSAMERMVTDSDFRMACSKAGKETAKRLASVSQEAYARAWVASLSHSSNTV